ncbi:hypothetical protein [Pseudomonas serbica]|jgi:anti-sigma factor RsiW|uniref:hypothetical protein n=1 Tax=Pseudomonas serbica TaxID=2965074 RepID=UPI00237A89F1|nr:hypothetical protein [Pseudomonas serbica]
MKYVMFIKDKDGDFPIAYPVLFPNNLVHQEVAEALIAGPLESFEVRSAGELTSVGKGLGVTGKSDTLGVKSHPDDEQIINMQDYGGYML